MARLTARLDALARRLGTRGRVVVVSPAHGPGDVPGAILSIPTGFRMVVPQDFADDPVAGLSDDQRRLIGPNDRVVQVVWTAKWRGEQEDGQVLTMNWPDDGDSPRVP